VLGADKLKPISWRDWAGQIERDGGARNPYLSLEERYGFWDIRVSLNSFVFVFSERCDSWVCFQFRDGIWERKRPWMTANGWRATGYRTELTSLFLELQAKRKEFADWMRSSDPLIKE
jgi:hypothetical protein